jgi:hypothetical protein
LLPPPVAAYAALFQGSDVTLLHACAKHPNVPFSIPLRLLSLGADPNALCALSISVWHPGRCYFGPTLQKLSVLASAVRHRAAQTQLALLTCPRLVVIAEKDDLPWYKDGYSWDGKELAAVWPMQQENQAAQLRRHVRSTIATLDLDFLICAQPLAQLRFSCCIASWVCASGGRVRRGDHLNAYESTQPYLFPLSACRRSSSAPLLIRGRQPPPENVLTSGMQTPIALEKKEKKKRSKRANCG